MTKKRSTRRKDGSQHALGNDLSKRIAELSGPIYYTTTTGVEVECLPIQGKLEAVSSAIRSRMEMDGGFPPIPNRIIHGAGGVSIKQDIDQEWVGRKDTPAEDKKAWKEYVREKEEAEKRFSIKSNDATVEIVVTEGIRVVDDSLLEKWAAEIERFGGLVPGDDKERKILFATGYIFGSGANGLLDTVSILARIRRASGQDPEVLSIVEDSFRARMGSAGRTDSSGGPGTAGESETQGA